MSCIIQPVVAFRIILIHSFVVFLGGGDHGHSTVELQNGIRSCSGLPPKAKWEETIHICLKTTSALVKFPHLRLPMRESDLGSGF